ncbi:hypothetical protein [Cellulomonas soli]
MSMTWGPALDAELAYRHERVVALMRGTGLPRTPQETNPERALARRRVGEARRAAPRGWWLRGSGAWHAAR